jgi:hypothetical protein
VCVVNCICSCQSACPVCSCESWFSCGCQHRGSRPETLCRGSLDRPRMAMERRKISLCTGLLVTPSPPPFHVGTGPLEIWPSWLPLDAWSLAIDCIHSFLFVVIFWVLKTKTPPSFQERGILLWWKENGAKIGSQRSLLS